MALAEIRIDHGIHHSRTERRILAQYQGAVVRRGLLCGLRTDIPYPRLPRDHILRKGLRPPDDHKIILLHLDVAQHDADIIVIRNSAVEDDAVEIAFPEDEQLRP